MLDSAFGSDVEIREKTQQLTKEKELLGIEMGRLVNMRDLDGVDGRIRKILQRQNELDDQSTNRLINESIN